MKLKNGVKVDVKPYCEADTEEIISLIRRNFKEVNVKDYGEQAMEKLSESHDAAWFRNLAGFAHVSVFWAEEKIVGVGSIASFWGSPTESILLTIFVLPELHGQGLGRHIVHTLEQDEFFLRAERVEIPASITAVEFYRKMGYGYKNGLPELDGEQLYRLEKFKQPAKEPSSTEICLHRASLSDAKELHAMQVESFRDLLEKYRDFSTNPANESVEKVELRLKQSATHYYFICLGGQRVGAIRIVDKKEPGGVKRISPLFVLPEFRKQGIAQKAIQICEGLHGKHCWELSTILQETGNCHLYEKVGYRKTGRTEIVNERMTLVFYAK